MVDTKRNWFRWIILTAGFTAGFYVHTFVFATLFCFGSLFIGMLDKFHENVSRTATVHAIFKGSGLTLGIFTGMLISRFGMRKISLTGGIMASLGFILSFLATSIIQLYISIDIIADMHCVGKIEDLFITIPWLTSRYRFKWIILAAGFYVNTFVFTTVFSFGSLFNDMLEKFHANVSRTATVHALFKASGLTLGVFTGIPISRFGMRKVSLIGGIMAPFGFILSFLATSIVHLYVSIGIIAGIGTSMIAIAATTVGNHSLSGSQRLLALSIQNMGMSVGGALTPYLFNYFVKNYGLNGNFLLMGGLYLNCLPAAILFSIPHQRNIRDKKNEPQSVEIADSETQTKPTSPTCISIFNIEMRRLKTEIHRVLRVLHPPFILTALGMGLAMSSLGGVNSLILDILKWKGLSSDEARLAFPVSYGVGLIVRLIPGIAKQFKKVNSFVCPIIFSLCGACGQLIFLFFSDIIFLLIGCGFMGVAIARLASGINIVVAQIVDQEQISIGIGLIYSTLGILTTVYGPTYGAIRDASKSYDVVLYLAFGFQLLGTALFLVTIFVRKFQSKGTTNAPKGQDNYTFNSEV